MRQNNTQLQEVETANMMEVFSCCCCFSLPSNLPYNITPQQALGYPEIQRRLDVSLGHLLVLADKFLSAILSSVDKIPYGFSATSLLFCCPPPSGVGTWLPARNRTAGVRKWPQCQAISGLYNEILLELAALSQLLRSFRRGHPHNWQTRRRAVILDNLGKDAPVSGHTALQGYWPRL